MDETKQPSEIKPEIETRISRNGKFIIAVALSCLAIAETFAAHPTNLLLLVIFLTFWLFLSVSIFSLVTAMKEWCKYRWRALVPTIVCVFVMLIFFPLGQLVKKAVFAWCFPSYEAIVLKVKSGEIHSTTSLNEIPLAKAEARLAQRVLAEKIPNGDVVVIIFTESGFPAKHGGYMYSSSGHPESEINSAYSIGETGRSNWFRISN